MTSEMGREFELPKTYYSQHCFQIWNRRPTPMAMMKFCCLFFSLKPFDMPQAQRYDIRVWPMKIKGMMARSTSFSAVSWDASFVKTVDLISKNDSLAKQNAYLGMA